MARIELRNVSVEFPVYNVNARSLKKEFLRLATGGTVSEDANHHIVVRSLQDVSLSLKHGDRIGLIGHNGAGKSTLLRLLANIYETTAGDILVDGHVSAMLNLMQGIEVEFTGYENIMQRGILLGRTKDEIEAQIHQIAESTGLGDYLAMPVRTYSSGMRVRLAFAIITSINPEILLIDEVFAAGDAEFMRAAKERMAHLTKQASIVIIATHADDLIKGFCNKALLLDNGKIKFFGDIDTGLELYHAKNKMEATA